MRGFHVSFAPRCTRRASYVAGVSPRRLLGSGPSPTSGNSNGKGNEDVGAKSKRFSKELWTVPNMITISRIVASPGLALAIAYDMKEVALVGCLVAGFSDWLDGYIAKNYNQMTVLGGMLDPIADKVMVGSLTAGMAYKGLLPMELAGVIVGRDAILLAASFALRWYEQPKGAPFFDTTYSATFEIVPSNLSKFNTGAQFVLLSCTLSHFALGSPMLASLEPLWWITGGTTVLSGLGYVTGSGVRRLRGTVTGQGRGLENSAYDDKEKKR